MKLSSYIDLMKCNYSHAVTGIQSYIHARNLITSSSHRIRLHIHSMIFSHIYNHEMHHLFLSKHAQSHETQSHLHSMKFSRNINLKKCTNYCHPNNSSHCFHKMKCIDYSYEVTVFIQWNSVTSSCHEIQSHHHSMKFSHIYIPCNLVTFCIPWNSMTQD